MVLTKKKKKKKKKKWAEPLNVAQFVHGGPDESVELTRAWKLVLENHFHDTICTSSVPQVTIEARVRAERAIQIAEAISAQAMARLMERIVPVSKERFFVFNPTNIVRKHELVVAWMSIPRSTIIDAGQILTVTDSRTMKKFNATVLSFEGGLWCYRHKKGGFRSGHGFNMVKLAMRPPVIEANEMRLLQVSHNPEYGQPETSSTSSSEVHLRRRKKTTSSSDDEAEATADPSVVVGEFGNDLLHCQIMRDGSLLVTAKKGQFEGVQHLNNVFVQQDTGTQYLAAYGMQISPIRMEKLHIERNPEFEHVSFKLRGYDVTVRVGEFQRRQNDDKMPKKMSFDIGVHYVLAASSSQIMTRVTMNHPEGGSKNFALRVAHFTSCKKELENSYCFFWGRGFFFYVSCFCR